MRLFNPLCKQIRSSDFYSQHLAFCILLFIGNLVTTKPQLNTMAAIAVLMAILWITEAIPLAVTSLIPLIFFPITGILSTEEIASSYMNSIILLFLGGFLIAIAMEEWALHKRIALKIITLIGGTLNSIILGFMVSGAFLSMWISNTATALMLLPIGLSVIQKLENEFGNEKTHHFTCNLIIVHCIFLYAWRYGNSDRHSTQPGNG